MKSSCDFTGNLITGSGGISHSFLWVPSPVHAGCGFRTLPLQEKLQEKTVQEHLQVRFFVCLFFLTIYVFNVYLDSNWVCMHAKSLQSCPILFYPMDYRHPLHPHHVSLSIGLSWQEYWSWSPCPPPRDRPHPGI